MSRIASVISFNWICLKKIFHFYNLLSHKLSTTIQRLLLHSVIHHFAKKKKLLYLTDFSISCFWKISTGFPTIFKRHLTKKKKKIALIFVCCVNCFPSRIRKSILGGRKSRENFLISWGVQWCLLIVFCQGYFYFVSEKCSLDVC